MKNENSHVTGYFTFGIVLLALLILTALTIMVAGINIRGFSAAVALLIASIKVRTVIAYFMHLRSERRLIRFMVVGVFALYGLVIIITFIDYLFR